MDGRLESGREETEQKKMEEDPTLKRSYKSVIHNTKREIFKEHDRVRDHQDLSKVYHIRQKTLYTLDHKNIQNNKEL